MKHLNLYSKRIRQTFCEALLGKGALIVEGDSDRWWVSGASRIMNRTIWSGRRQEALELQGICVVSADANSELVKLGTFFYQAGVEVVCLADRVADTGAVSDLCSAPFSVLFVHYRGLEELLVAELSVDLMRVALATAPHSRIPPIDQNVVDTSSEGAVRQMFRQLLDGNKGSAQFHEWLLSKLDAATLPRTLKEISDISSLLVSRQLQPCKMSLL